MNSNSKILSIQDLSKVRSNLRAKDIKVVQCHGCFDIVHPGHIRHLGFAKSQGDILIVSITADSAIDKGYDRPYINQDLRAENLAALECVDYICIDNHDWAGPILDKIQPDIFIKGKEYEASSHTSFLKEKELVESYGGKVIFSSGDVVYSSTYIINEFRERFNLQYEQIAFFCRQNNVTIQRIEKLFHKFAEQRVLVIGDPILDHYIHCDALGIAAESPIISVSPMSDEWFLGGAGLIAMQCAALGARAGFLTLTSENPETKRFRENLAKANVSFHEVKLDERPTYVKLRYLVDENKVFKVDVGSPVPPSSSAASALLKTLEEHIAEYDALLLVDFGYGLFSGELIEAIPKIARKNGIPYYVDVSSNRQVNITKFQRPRLVSPTEQEIRTAFADNECGISNLASRFYRETDAEKLIITMGKRGVLLFSPPEEGSTRLRTDYLPAFAEKVADTIGAGDVFHAAVVLTDLAGGAMHVGSYLGSCMAALHVGRMGNVPVMLIDTQEYLTHRQELKR